MAGYADSLGEYARKMSMNLQTLQNDINTEISSTVKQINAYAEQLASLTKQINSLEVYVTPKPRKNLITCRDRNNIRPFLNFTFPYKISSRK